MRHCVVWRQFSDVMTTRPAVVFRVKGEAASSFEKSVNLYQKTRCHSVYLLVPYSRFLLEKLTGFQLVKKFPAFYGTRMFITALTSASHLSLC